MSEAGFTLDDKYTKRAGRVFLTGTQALVRLPLAQRWRDAAAGLNTAGLVTGYRGKYHIATLRLADKSLQVLTDTPLDESPSFAPNGGMILYATELRGRGVLASVSSDGRVRQLYTEQGDVREPAWSPYNRDLQSKE